MVNRKDLEELFADLAKNNKIVRLQAPLKNSLEKFDKEADSTYRAEFNRIIQKGEKLGIVWARVAFS
jgi:bacterioferritin (cytochrome b1)